MTHARLLTTLPACYFAGFVVVLFIAGLGQAIFANSLVAILTYAAVSIQWRITTWKGVAANYVALLSLAMLVHGVS